MSGPDAATSPPPRRRSRRRRIALAAVIGLLLVTLTVAVVRGTWADRVEKDPTRPGEVVCHLYRPAEGPWQVRCAALLEHPPQRVWAVVTDYDHFEEIFPTLKSAAVERREGGRVRLRGEAYSNIGTWPYDIVIAHDEEGDGGGASWEGSSGDVQSIRGGWEVTPAGEGMTRLVYRSHVELRGWPDWLVVNVLLFRQPGVVRAVAERLDRKE